MDPQQVIDVAWKTTGFIMKVSGLGFRFWRISLRSERKAPCLASFCKLVKQ